MAFGLFKNGDELFTEGVDLIKRKEYKKATKQFHKALDKETSNEDLSRLYIIICDLCDNDNDAAEFINAAEKINSSNVKRFQFGLTEVDSKEFALECTLMAEEIEIAGRPDSMEKGKALKELAQKYQMNVGNKPLKINEILKGETSSTGISEALVLQATAYETMGMVAVMSDPKKGAEYMQMAYNFRRQIGDSGEKDMNMMKGFSRSVKCWLCGRTVTGEGIHFVTTSSDVAPVFKEDGSVILKSSPEDNHSIYMCKPCYSAISNRSDQISRAYYDKAMEEMHRMEMRLEAEIAAVRYSK